MLSAQCLVLSLPALAIESLASSELGTKNYELSTNQLDIAQNALRDGLWEIARTHAAQVDSTEGRLIIVESYARESKWDEVLKTLDQFANETGDTFTYYRALALVRTGKIAEAEALLSSVSFADETCKRLVILLRAGMSRLADKPADIVKLAQDPLFPAEDVSARMLLAWAKEKTGERPEAEKLWRTVIAETNVDERALAAAATALGDAASLRVAEKRMQSAPLRRAVGLRLGRALLTDDKSFDEGVKMIRFLAKDAPDTDGAKEAFVALADAYLKKEQNQEAADAYHNALEAWPETARELPVLEGRAWALRNLAKNEEALEMFARAEEVATNAIDQARTILAQGDVLSDLGRGAEAMAKYRVVLDTYPGTPSGQKLKIIVELREMEAEGRTLYRNFRFREAQEKFAELARRDPARQPRMDYLEMLCLYGQGRDDEAARKASAIAARSSDAAIRAEATLWLAKFSFNTRQWRESCALFANYATNLMPTSAQAPSALTWSARAAFAAQDYLQTVNLVTRLAKDHPDAAEKAAAWLIQGEALIELARLEEAILVLEKVALTDGALPEERFRARRLKADVLFVMGADNPVRYREALDGYRALLLGESLTADDKLALSFKIGRTLEKLDRMDEAIDQYYSEVVLAYREGRRQGISYDEESKAIFSRAAFRLAEEFERRGDDRRAEKVLSLVIKSDVASSAARAKEIRKRLQKKGSHQ